MEAILGMSLSEIFSRITTEPLILLKTLLVFWWHRLFGTQRRFDLYDVLTNDDLSKTGLFVPPLEYQVEKPQEQLQSNASDAVLFYGGNSSGTRLVVNICREKEGHVSWFFLRMADGRTYQPTAPDTIYPPSGSFVAGGLRIKCLMPMRRWRVSFNGILREAKDDSGQSRLVHVKFAFIWVSSSYPYDLSTDINPMVVAEYIATQSTVSVLSKRQRLTKFLDTYIQAGSLLGTVSIDGSDDTEVFLWGARRRRKCPVVVNGTSHLTELIGYSKDGQLIYSGEYEPQGFKGKLSFAFHLERSSLSFPVISCRQQTLQGKGSSFPGMKVDIKTERSSICASVDSSNFCLESRGFGAETKTHFTHFKLQDEDTGYAVVMENTWKYPAPTYSERLFWKMPKPGRISQKSKVNILKLDEVCSLDSNLSGGKGASLAALTQLARKYKTGFQVPKGFVVTSSAYKGFYESAGVQESVAKLQANAWSYHVDQIKDISREIVSHLSKCTLSVHLKSIVQKQLAHMFPEDGVKKRFAVRSSASGEDSEEMSAAGQMSTYLGIEGLDNICQGIVKCWASQFSFTAIQYKRQNGQELNSPMAVVIQEIVAADSAGVLFTCDPVTGNPQNITITANYGLGESVVSASADPDTFVLNRDEHNHVTLASVQTGKKEKKIIMKDSGTVEEEESNENTSNSCCLSEDQSISISEAGIKIERAYGFPVDIEWALKDGQLFLLQARPVTTFDQVTRFEVEHATSTALRCEDEYNTRANVGEVVPGFYSHFGQSFMDFLGVRCTEQLFGHRNKYAFPFNPFFKISVMCNNQVFMNFPNALLRFYQSGGSFLADATIVSFFGKLLDDPDLLDQAARRNKTYPVVTPRFQLLYFLSDIFLSERRLTKCVKKYWDQEINLRQCSNSKEMFKKIWNVRVRAVEPWLCHCQCSMVSSIFNNIVMGFLAEGHGGWGVNVFSDFALLTSSCGNFESADIPRSMAVVTKSIRNSINIDQFKGMSPAEALNWIQTTKSSAGADYSDFIKKHGHRGLKEFDMYYKPWRMDQLSLVKVLQASVDSTNKDKKTFVSANDVIKQLKFPLTWKKRLLLRFLIPMCRRRVFNRERSKSMSIKMIDCTRKAVLAFGEQLVKEGRLPEIDLLFFLTQQELAELVVSRSSALVQSAQRRKQVSGDLDKLKFPEITKGIPFPINRNTEASELEDNSSDLEITGTPVSRGVVRGYARVATTLDEALNIKHGEILIAFSTDIAWSPYFPLLSGIATELGGLISHGAVVAREYGLPCVVGVHGATYKFKTGDYIMLDGNNGLIRRIQDPQAE